MEIGIQEVNTKRVDHYGIIAGVCDELEIVEQIDSILGPIDPRKNISYGQAVKLMIINGLGFVNHRLYTQAVMVFGSPILDREPPVSA